MASGLYKMQFVIVVVLAMSCMWMQIVQVTAHTHSSDEPYLLLMSFDGFRHDYLDLVKKSGRKTPNFDKLLENGAMVKRLRNSFETKTLPNHFTIVTGMYEENHGVVSNYFYDLTLNISFSPQTSYKSAMFDNGTDQKRGGEPIWVTYQKASTPQITRKSGVLYWPGNEAEIHHMRPSFFKHYDEGMILKDNIDKVIQWFTTDPYLVNLGLMYFKQPDSLGHTYGPTSDEVFDMIVQIDNGIGSLIEQLQEHDLFDKMNIIITSDHGMTTMDEDKLIELDSHLERSTYDMYGSSPVFNIRPIEDKGDEVYDKLKKIEHLHTYWSREVPGNYHYSHNRRIQQIVIEADEHWAIARNKTGYKYLKGNHGYNNSNTRMQPFFIAHGPAFRKGASLETINNVDIYPMMCSILGITPAANDGNLMNVKPLLSEKHQTATLNQISSFYSTTMVSFLIAVGLAATLAGVFCVAACRVQRRMKQRNRLMNVPISLYDGLNGHTQKLLQEDEEEEIP